VSKSLSSKGKGLSSSTLVTLALAAVAVIYVFAIFVPTQKSISRARQEVLDLQEHVLRSDRLTLPIQNVQQKMLAVESFMRRHDSMLPETRGELQRTFGRISEQAKLAGVIVRRFDPKGTTELHSLRQAHLDVSLEGSFPQLMDFLSRLEELPHVIWLTNVNLGKVEGNEQTLLAELSLTIFGDLADQSDSNGS
jgi:Tfp pilus assembly protein PilO